ncbi:MAG: DNA-3-methyladenine glycosylase [Bacteroidia bacterium]
MFNLIENIQSQKFDFQLITRDFYERANVTQIARELLGKYLFSFIDNVMTAGMIVETEAYCGENDKACHAFNGLTSRTQVMFGEAGHAYVYLCYGIHQMFNVVTNVRGKADAVLIRSIQPVFGVEEMLKRRKKTKLNSSLTSGPGCVAQALGIHFKQHHGTDLLGNTIWIMENKATKIPDDQIFETIRIGVEYAGESALLPWRFYIKDNEHVSRKVKN